MASVQNQEFNFPVYHPPLPPPQQPHPSPQKPVPPPPPRVPPPPHHPISPSPPLPPPRSRPPPAPIVKPPPPHKSSPPPPAIVPPPPPHKSSPPPAAIVPPPPHHPIHPPPPHIVPSPPPPAPPGHHSAGIVVVIFISFGGLLFLAFLAVALSCFIRKRKKKMAQETDMVNIDEHIKVREAIIPGPNGPQVVVLSTEKDVHIQEEIKKNEEVTESSHVIRSAQDNHERHGGNGGKPTATFEPSHYYLLGHKA